MLSDNEKNKDRKSVRRRGTGEKSWHKHWSDSQKIEIVTTYLALGGNIALTAATMKIPATNIYQWRRTEWWHNIEEEIKKQERLTLSVSLKSLSDKALTAVNDRLENGDWIYNQKTGELLRKPVAMKDAHKVASEMIDKRIKIDQKDTFTVAQENIQDKLNQLAKSFSELASKKPQLIAQEIDFKEKEDAVYEEREEGLQDGV